MKGTKSPNKLQRILIHLTCQCKNWRQFRFHVTGVIRELVPLSWQRFIH